MIKKTANSPLSPLPTKSNFYPHTKSQKSKPPYPRGGCKLQAEPLKIAILLVTFLLKKSDIKNKPLHINPPAFARILRVYVYRASCTHLPSSFQSNPPYPRVACKLQAQPLKIAILLVTFLLKKSDKENNHEPLVSSPEKS